MTIMSPWPLLCTKFHGTNHYNFVESLSVIRNSPNSFYEVTTELIQKNSQEQHKQGKSVYFSPESKIQNKILPSDFINI